MYRVLWWETQKESIQKEDVDTRIKLEWVFKKDARMHWMETGSSLYITTVMNLRSPQNITKFLSG
jgi:hypothetical protein